MARISIIHHSGIVGGAGVSLINTIRILAQEHDVTVFISSEPDDMKRILEDEKKRIPIEIIEYGRRIGALTYYSGGDRAGSPRFLYRAGLILWQWSMWNRYLKKMNPDIVIVNSMILSWMSKLPEIKKRKSVCFVRETVADNPENRMNQIIQKLLNDFSQVIFLSEYDRARSRLPIEKTSVIRNFIEPEKLNANMTREDAGNALNIPTESFHVLYVGGVSYMKGFDLAVKAALGCSCRVDLICAGNSIEDRRKQCAGTLPEYESTIEAFIQNNDRDHRIHLIGRQTNMTACYAAADVLLFPMRSPHQARPVFEAGWFSRPVIITGFENITEDVQNGFNGLTVIANDEQPIIQKIQYLSTHPEKAVEMGINNHNLTVKNHSKEKNSKQILKVIKELLER